MFVNYSNLVSRVKKLASFARRRPFMSFLVLIFIAGIVLSFFQMTRSWTLPISAPTGLLALFLLCTQWMKEMEEPTETKDTYAGQLNAARPLSPSLTPDDPVKRDTLYSSAVQLVIASENVTWARIYDFLTANSILMLAWATVYVGTDSPVPCPRKFVLVVMSLVGFFLSVLLAPFSSRNRRIQQNYVHKAMALELDLKDVNKDNYADEKWKRAYGAMNWGEMAKFPAVEHYIRSRKLVVILPMFFAAAFLAALLVSLAL